MGDSPIGQVPILMYHSISEQADPRFARFVVQPHVFRRHMSYLAERGYQTMTVTALVNAWESGTPLPPNTVVLTFDDGFADFYTEVVPSLLDHHFTADLYLATGFVGKTCGWLGTSGEGNRPMLTWPRVQEVASLGFEIGSHTHSHPELDRCPASTTARELNDSRNELEDRLGGAVNTFAYPFGYWSKRVRGAVAEAGFRSGFRSGSCHLVGLTTYSACPAFRSTVARQRLTSPRF